MSSALSDSKPVYITDDPDYFKEFKPRAEVSSCLMEVNGKYLVLKRCSKEDQSFTWGIPGGKLEEDEAAVDAMAREILEETGLEVDKSALHKRAFLYGRVPGWDYKLHVFHLSAFDANFKVQLSAEHTEYKWATSAEMEAMDLVKGQDQVFRYINLKDDFYVDRILVSRVARKTNEVAKRVFSQEAPPQRLVINLIGTTGVGKGTQGQFIQEAYGIRHISIGDLFRDEIRNGTDLGKQILWHDKETNCSRYNPDEITLGIMIKNLAKDCSSGFILDGFPRTRGQSNTMVNAFLRPDDLHIVVWMKIDDNHIYERVKGRFICGDCGTQYRAHQKLKKADHCDDCDVKLTRRVEDANVASVTKRLKIFNDNNDGVLEEILKRDDVYTLHLNNEHGPEEVYKAIKTVIDRVLKESHYVGKR
jgi:adenylate kinase